MEKGDWFAVALSVLFCGAGLLLQSFSQRFARWSGVALIALGFIGSAGWFGYYRSDAGAQPPPSINGNCNAVGNNNFNCSNIINPAPTPRHMNPVLANDILTKVPKDKDVRLDCVATDKEAYDFALEIFAFMKENNYKMVENRVISALYTPPLQGLRYVADENHISVGSQ
jgi:hypothetical protein